VQALARTQQLFFETGRASLDTVVRGELAGFPDQLSVDGVEVSLTPIAAQNFTLIVHELAINALKHGALSLPSGRIQIRWRRENGQLVLSWTEQGGPEVSLPTREGFGHVILHDLAQGFGASVVSEYPRTGFRYTLKVALRSVAETATPLPEAASL
jgi:two-component sensor histidine kinase